ncbi:diguanylate cyclase [Vibrio sp. RC27]
MQGLLSRKITLIFSAGLILVTVILVTMFSKEISNRYHDVLIERGNNAASKLVFQTEKLLKLGLLPEEFNGYETLLSKVFDNIEGLLSVTLCDESGKSLFTFPNTDDVVYTENKHLLTFSHTSNMSSYTIKKAVSSTVPHQLYIVVELDQNYIFKNTTAFINTILLHSGIVSLLAILAILVFLRLNFGQPLHSLISQIQSLEVDQDKTLQSDLTQRKDEIGIVANSFEQLIKRLSYHQDTLAKTNQELMSITEELEYRVSMRTHELEEANEKLESIAHYDFLTGLFNRHNLKSILEQRIEYCKMHNQTFALIMLDLDDFKLINDKYGHTAGDVVLGTIGQRMRNSLDDLDYIFRFGGDEFILIVEDFKDIESLEILVINIKDVISQPVPYENLILPVNVSIGVSFSDIYESFDIDKIIQLADNSMYKAKKNKLDYVINNIM